MDIQHILYSTIGDEFEKYLDGEDLLAMSKVSHTTRDTVINVKFRRLLEITLTEYKIFKTNNNHDGVDLNYDLFFQSIPLGVIYKNAQLDTGFDIYQLLDYLNCDNKTRTYVFIELCHLEDFRRFLHSDYSGDIDYYWDLLEQASIRLRDDIVELLLNDPIGQDALDHFDQYQYYAANERLASLFINAFHNYLGDSVLVLYDPNNEEYSNTLLHYATSFQEQDTFRELYSKHSISISERFDTILNTPSLKYNIMRNIVEWY